jgi:ATP-dependent Clp protease protease subunit
MCVINNIMQKTLDTASERGMITVCEKDNTIHFNTGINPKTISELIEKLQLLEGNALRRQKKLKRKLSDFMEDDKNADESEAVDIVVKIKPITLYITSNGGWVYQAFAAIDTIRSLKVPVNTVCKGFVASAGTLLSLAGKKRYITENSYMLIHELRSGTWGKYSQMAEDMENSRDLMTHIRDYYVKYTNMSADELDEQLKRDVCWNAATCLEKGLVDEII